MNNDRLFFIVQSCLKYNSFGWGVKLRAWLYKPFFKSFGKNIQIKDGVTFKYPSEMELGDHCKIGEFSYFVAKGGLKMGNNLLLGSGTKIITSRHNWEELDTPMFDQGLTFEPITIGNDVWFGFDAKVFGKTNIGNGVVVGANALVKNMDVPDYAVLAGSPAVIIKYRSVRPS